jgi:hypothetical protein
MQLALIYLNHPAHYFSFGPFAISGGNLAIIISMAVIFLLALFLPFPHSQKFPREEKMEDRK